MDYTTHYTNILKSINTELARLNARAKELRNEKKNIEEKLYRVMARNEIREVNGIKMQTLQSRAQPKPKTIRRKPEEKKRDIIVMLRNSGLPNPEEMYQEIMRAQKPVSY